MEKMKEWINRIAIFMLTIGTVLPCIPYIWTALYTFPSQDDFKYSDYIKEIMAEGHSAFSSSVIDAADKYMTHRGYFFSCFLYNFFDSIIDCSIWGTRIFCAGTILLFYVSLFILIYIIAKRILKTDTVGALLADFFVFFVLNATFYYNEHEIFYWMCSTQVSLVPLVLIFTTSILLVLSIENKNLILLTVTSMFGFLIGGSLPNIAMVGSELWVMMLYYEIVVKKKSYKYLLALIPIIVGGLMNVLAPSTFNTVGQKEGRLLETVLETGSFLMERTLYYVSEYTIVVILLVILFLYVFFCEKTSEDKYPIPIFFVLAMILAQYLVHFPVVYAYGIECCKIMQRTMFVSDMVSAFTWAQIVIYLAKWLRTKVNPSKIKKIGWAFVGVCVAACILWISVFWVKMSICFTTYFLFSGKTAEFADWSVGIIEQVEDSNDDIVIIYDTQFDERTPLRWPYYHFGEYDPDNEYTGNSSMAIFFGKKAIFILPPE